MFSEKLHIVIVKSGSIVILNTNAWADNILQNKKIILDGVIKK